MALRWRHEGWRKLYVREEGTFAQLPLYARALAAELLKIIDSAGRIDCNGKEPWRAIAWRLGATRGDRRMLKRDLDLLLEDGYLVRDPQTGDLIVRNFLLAHPHLVVEEAEGVDRVATEDGQEGAEIYDLPVHRAAARGHRELGDVVPLHHGQGEFALVPPPPVVTDQLGFGWAPPPPVVCASVTPHNPERASVAPTSVTPEVLAAVQPPQRAAHDPRPVHDGATTVQRKVTQLAAVLSFRSEDQRRSDPRGDQRAHPDPLLSVVPTDSRSQMPPEGGVQDLDQVARTLAGEQERLRREVDPDVPSLPLTDTTTRILRLLRGGWTEEVLRHALVSAAFEAQQKRTLRWFNGVDNWKEDSMRRALAARPARRAAPAPRAPTSSTSSTTQPVALPAGERAGMAELAVAWAALGIAR